MTYPTHTTRLRTHQDELAAIEMDLVLLRAEDPAIKLLTRGEAHK